MAFTLLRLRRRSFATVVRAHSLRDIIHNVRYNAPVASILARVALAINGRFIPITFLGPRETGFVRGSGGGVRA